MTLAAALQADLDQGRPERAWDRAAALYQEGRPAARHRARLALSQLVDRLHDAAWTPSRRRQADQLGLRPGPPKPRLGELAFPAVGAAQGRFVTARVRRSPSAADLFPVELEAEAQKAAQAAFAAVRALEGLPSLHFSLHTDGRFDWGGASCGLAIALAALSEARARPLPTRLCATGRVDADGRVAMVGALADKRALRSAARPAGRMLVAAEDDAPDVALVPVSSLVEAAAAAWPEGDRDPVEAMRAIQQKDRNGQWLDAARGAESLIQDPDLSEEERATLGVILLQAANHAGDGQAAEGWARQVDALLAGLDDGALWAQAIGSQAVARIDALDAPGAAALLAMTAPLPMPKAARVHLLGPEALLATLTGDLDRALALRQAALEACAPDEHPRCQGDLADALLRMGQAEAALRACDLGLAACRGGRRSLGYRNRTAAFLHLHRARCAVALGLPLAPDALNLPLALPGPDPWLRACLLQAEATRSPEGARAALSRLPDYVRHAPIVAALLHRCLGRLGDEAAAARLVETAPFVGLSFAEAARRLPY